jgi:hypothetical protein
MAQVTGESSGLQVIASQSAEPDEDDLPEEQRLLMDAITKLRKGQIDAALECAADAINLISAQHSKNIYVVV